MGHLVLASIWWYHVGQNVCVIDDATWHIAEYYLWKVMRRRPLYIYALDTFFTKSNKAVTVYFIHIAEYYLWKVYQTQGTVYLCTWGFLHHFKWSCHCMRHATPGPFLDGTKPLSAPMLVYCELSPQQQLQRNLNWNSYIFIQENAFENVVHFVSSCVKTLSHSDEWCASCLVNIGLCNRLMPWVTYTQIAKFMGPTWGPPGSCRPQTGPMLAPWTLLSE